MKNYLMMIGAAVVILAAGCKPKLNQPTVDKLQTELKSHKEAVERLNGLSKEYQMLAGKLDALDEKQKNSEAFASTKAQVTTMQTKADATFSAYKDLIAKLEKLSSDYAEGKIKKEDVDKEFDALLPGISEHRLILEDRVRDLKMLNGAYLGIQSGQTVSPVALPQEREKIEDLMKKYQGQLPTPDPKDPSKMLPPGANSATPAPPKHQ
jgi:chromosome segregation ATPase